MGYTRITCIPAQAYCYGKYRAMLGVLDRGCSRPSTRPGYPLRAGVVVSEARVQMMTAMG